MSKKEQYPLYPKEGQNQSSNETEEKKKGCCSSWKWVLIVFGVAFVVGSVLLGICYFKDSNKQEKVEKQKQVASSTEKETNENNVLDWKTYQDITYDFEIEYPAHWTVEKSGSVGLGSIHFFDNASEKDGFIFQKNFQGSWLEVVQQEEKITVDGVEGTLSLAWTCEGIQDWDDCRARIEEEDYDIVSLRVLFTNGDDRWMISESWEKGAGNSDEKIKELRQILDTFKFLGQISAQSFQEILANNCQKTAISETSYFYGIKPTSLPVSVDSSILELDLEDGGVLMCTGVETGREYVVMGYYQAMDDSEKQTLNLYDNNSEPIGHGGWHPLETWGKVIKDDGTVKLSIFLGWPAETIPSLVSNMAVWMRGEKKLPRSNGESIFVNSTNAVIDKENSRLVAILDSYGEEITQDFLDTQDFYGRELVDFAGEKFLNASDEDAILDDVAVAFFSDMDGLASSEKERVAVMERILGAVVGK